MELGSDFAGTKLAVHLGQDEGVDLTVSTSRRDMLCRPSSQFVRRKRDSEKVGLRELSLYSLGIALLKHARLPEPHIVLADQTRPQIHPHCVSGR
jgi:hypothetical protein